jgi:hypothetical protein
MMGDFVCDVFKTTTSVRDSRDFDEMDKADSTVALIQLGTKRDATDFQSPRP